MRSRSYWLPIFVAVVSCLLWSGTLEADETSGLQQQLAKESAAALAKAAHTLGDPSRGAVVFYRPELNCTRCHTAGEDGARLGPDLAKLGKEATDEYLVES